MAAFRIASGALIVADLLLRSRDLVAHYTDFGVLPRAVVVSRFAGQHRISIHYLSGDAWAQALLFLVAGAFAVALAVGYRTRFATVASWLLLLSLHNRNPLVLNGGDALLRMFLLWGVFLPLGERWSIDARRSDRRRGRVFGVATAALLLQVVVVYSVNAVFKLRGDLWVEGEALYYVLSLDFFTVFLGDVLYRFPLVLHALDYLWMGLVSLSFLLIVLTGVPRILFVSLFAAMHAGMFLTMGLGLFPLISIAGLLPFLPGTVWDVTTTRLSTVRYPAAAERWPAKLDAALPEVEVSGSPPWLRRWGGRAMSLVVAALLVLVVLWNVGTLGYDAVPDGTEPAVYAANLDQYWVMFAPDPLRVDGWYVVPGRLEDGSRIDAFYGTPVQWDRPPDIEAKYPNNRWRKYLSVLWLESHAEDRPYFAEYLCRRWNSRHGNKLVRLTIYYMKQPTRPNYRPEPIERVKLLEHSCEGFIPIARNPMDD